MPPVFVFSNHILLQKKPIIILEPSVKFKKYVPFLFLSLALPLG